MGKLRLPDPPEIPECPKCHAQKMIVPIAGLVEIARELPKDRRGRIIDHPSWRKVEIITSRDNPLMVHCPDCHRIWIVQDFNQQQNIQESINTALGLDYDGLGPGGTKHGRTAKKRKRTGGK